MDGEEKAHSLGEYVPCCWIFNWYSMFVFLLVAVIWEEWLLDDDDTYNSALPGCSLPATHMRYGASVSRGMISWPVKSKMILV